jgi:anhydro-N-acetylmuramic acid kinase
LLFAGAANAFLNIGGFVNISIPSEQTVAFDICPGNLPLNMQVARLGTDYDAGGQLARSGRCSDAHLEQLNKLPFYQKTAPKSLGTEWLESEFLPILEDIPKREDRLNTCITHIAEQITAVCENYQLKSLYITGGGAYNTFLIEQIKRHGIHPVIPDDQTVSFKEALVFAFLGLRFLEGKHNCLASVTGATQNVCGGTLHTPN